MRRKRGFTLIESLAVIAIISVLATLATVVTIQAQRSGRDAKRKSDLYAISQGFEARALDKTCNTQTLVGLYPFAGQANTQWTQVLALKNQGSAQDCQKFSNYLSSIPDDPEAKRNFHYYFSVSATPFAKHYRLAASLERPSPQTLTDCARNSEVWTTTFGGPAYDCVGGSGNQIAGNRDYQYYIGR